LKPQLKDPTTVKSHGIKTSVSFGIKSSGLHHILGILRNQLYSDKILAVVREYTCNAVDAQTEAGCPERPIEVTLPTQMNPVFKVRDFGVALSDEDIQNVYAFYGESTKRNSNDQIGMLGIGSKAAFAYGDNFVINSYIDGEKHSYNAYIDPSQVGQISKLSTEDTNEENGIEIVVPVNTEDYSEFAERAKTLFKWFKVRPIVKGAPQFEYDEHELLFSGTNWEWRDVRQQRYSYSNNGQATAIMGNIGYPLDEYSLNLKSEDSDLSSLLCENLILKVEIGDLEISASREKLQYTDYTRKQILKKLKEVQSQLVEQVQKEFKNVKTMFEAKCLHGSIFDYSSPLYALRNTLQKSLKFNGKTVDSDSYQTYNHSGVDLHKFELNKNNTRYKMTEVNRIDCKKDVVVVENDQDHRRGVMGRVLTLILENKKTVYLIGYENAATKKKFVDDTKFDAPTKKLTSLEKKKLSDFEMYQNSSGTSYVGEKNSKYSAKLFKFKSDHDGARWDRKKSVWWSEASVDTSKGGVYLIIEQFEAHSKSFKEGRYGSGNVHPQTLQTVIKELKDMGVKIPTVYGIKVGAGKQRTKIENADNWTNFFDWARSELKQVLDKKGLTQAYVDRQAYRDWKSSEHSYRHIEELVDYLTGKNGGQVLGQLADRGSLFLTLAGQVTEMKSAKQSEKIDTFRDLGEKLHVDVDALAKEATPTHDLKVISDKVFKKYSMLRHIEYSKWGWNSDKEFKDDLLNYINVIDVCNVAK